MSAIPSLTPEERDLLAAELSLRLLGEDEQREARALADSDPQFAAAVYAWDARFGGLFDRIAPVEPPSALWDRVATAVARQRSAAPHPGGSASDNVIVLERRVGFWRRAAVGMTALAACLTLAIVTRDGGKAPPPPAPPRSELRVAAITPKGAPAMAVVSYDQDGGSLLVTPAALKPVKGHSHQLWVVPATGDPRSLGLVAPGATRRIALGDDLAPLFAGEATVAISAERTGGSRTGKPEGPVVATGKLRRV